MAGEDPGELRQMRLDAIRRAWEMHRRAQRRAGQSAPPEPPSAPAQERRESEKPEAGEAPPGEKPKLPPAPGFGQDQALILALILLLSGERRSRGLILALLYVLL